MGKFEEVSDDAADDDELEVHNVKLITFWRETSAARYTTYAGWLLIVSWPWKFRVCVLIR